MWVSGEWFAQAGLVIRASLTSGTNGRSSKRVSAPKDKSELSERIKLPISRWGACRISHLGPVLLRHLRFEIDRRGWARGTVLMTTFVSGVHNPKIMLGMLVKVLRGDSIATRRRLARESNVYGRLRPRPTPGFC
jgi:hypothetical protein